MARTGDGLTLMLRWILGTIGLFIVLGLVAIVAVSVSIGTFGYRQQPMDADVIIILGASVWPGGQPSPALHSRTMRGIELFKQGYAKRLILTGGLGYHPPAEAEVMRRIAVEAGVPDEAILIEPKAKSTIESARFVADLMADHGWRSAIVVSDPFHLARSRIMFKDQGIDVSTVGTHDTYYSTRTRVMMTVRETIALAYYLLSRPLEVSRQSA